MSDPALYTIEAVRADGCVGMLHVIVENEVTRVSFVPVEAPRPAGMRFHIAGGLYEDLPWSSGRNFQRAQRLEAEAAALPFDAPDSVRAAYAAEVDTALNHARLNRSINAHGPLSPGWDEDAQISTARDTLSAAGWIARGDIKSRRSRPDATVYNDADVQSVLIAAEKVRAGSGGA